MSISYQKFFVTRFYNLLFSQYVKELFQLKKIIEDCRCVGLEPNDSPE